MGLLAWVAWRLLGTDSIGRDGKYAVVNVSDRDGPTEFIQEYGDQIVPHGLLQTIEQLAESDDSPLTYSDLLTVIDSHMDTAESVGRLLQSVDDAEAFVQEVGLPAYKEPVKELTELEDSQEAIYVWEVPEEPNRNALMRAFEQNNVGDMQALHIVLTDKEQLTQFGPDDLRPYVDASIGGNE